MRKEPETRSHQTDAVVACVAELKKSPRVQCHMAPGSGKTVISLLIKEALSPKVTIFFVPSIQLIYQQYMSWAKFRKDDFDVLVITSARLSAANESQLATLRVNHVGTTTDADTVKSFLTNKHIKKDRVIFCTYKSSGKLITACKGRLIDLAIYDEAHHVSGRFDKRAIRSIYDNNIRIKHRLFMTATPKMCLDSDQALTAAGMDNTELFGRVAYTLSFKRAVELDILCDYQIVAAVVNENSLRDLRIKASKAEKISLAAVKKILVDKAGSRGLSFHSRVKRSRKFSEHLKSILPKKTYVAHMDSSHSGDDRVDIIGKLKKADTGIISNVRVLGEGFDYDALDFIVMVDPKSVVSEIVQNIGRVIRKHKDKKIGTIVIPIYQQDGDISMDDALNKSNFRQIYHIATALGEIDDMFGTMISTQRRLEKIDTPITIFTQKIKVISDKEITTSQIKDLVNKMKIGALYSTRQTISDNTAEGARDLFNYCKKHNRLPPVYRSKDATEEEKILIRTYNLLLTGTNLSPDVHAILMVVRNTWGKKGKSARGWEVKVSEILDYCEEMGHRPSSVHNMSWSNLIEFAKVGRIPKSAGKQLLDDIEKMLSYPTARQHRDDMRHRRINDIVLWIKQHKRAPTSSDVASGYFPKNLFILHRRRNSDPRSRCIQEEINKHINN